MRGWGPALVVVGLVVVGACLLDSRRGAGFGVVVEGFGLRCMVVVLDRLDSVAVRQNLVQLKTIFRRASLAVLSVNLMLERLVVMMAQLKVPVRKENPVVLSAGLVDHGDYVVKMV